MSKDEIEKAAMLLTSKEKAALSYKLLESIDSENIEAVDEIWKEEVDARLSQIKNKSVNVKDAESVINEAKLKYE